MAKKIIINGIDFKDAYKNIDEVENAILEGRLSSFGENDYFQIEEIKTTKLKIENIPLNISTEKILPLKMEFSKWFESYIEFFDDIEKLKNDFRAIRDYKSYYIYLKVGKVVFYSKFTKTEIIFDMITERDWYDLLGRPRKTVICYSFKLSNHLLDKYYNEYYHLFSDGTKQLIDSF